jgi:hypothetical protein
MQTEIMTYGPISAAFIVYQDFIDFFKKNATGIYMPTRPLALLIKPARACPAASAFNSAIVGALTGDQSSSWWAA